ncbi:MAG TPA: SCP2 sterol-binding domain-containing protein [Acidimicrobiia bacterium]|nr:SCP2 sterol-binding domain-containing protein [Acidimicrobiia bacterium]
MGNLANAQEVYDTIGAFLDQITKDEDMRPKFVAADTSFHVVYTDPDCDMLVDCTVDPPVVTLAPGDDAKAEIELEMAADDGHEFWLGKMNMALALAKGKVKVKGPISKIMKLLPAMRPAFPKYRLFVDAGAGGAAGDGGGGPGK